MRALPHSDSSERACLAAALLSPNLLPTLRERLEVEDFFGERHQAIYSAMIEIQEGQKEIDLRTLEDELGPDRFKMIGGVAYLAGLDLDLPDLGRITTYVEIVKERATRRKAVLACQEISHRAMESEIDASETIAELATMVAGLEDAGPGGGLRHLRESILDADYWSPITGGMLGLPTSLIDLDRMTLGLERGCQYIIAARPGAGKSSFAAGIAVAAARTGASVGVFSLEMPEAQWRDRILSQESWANGSQTAIALRRIRTHQIGRPESDAGIQLLATMSDVSRLPIYVDDRRAMTVDQIVATAASHKLQHGLDLMIVDHLGLIRYAGKAKSRNDQVGETCLRLREASKALDLPMVTLSQLSRNVESRSDKRPMLSDLRDSGEIEQHADAVYFLYRGKMYYDEDPDGIIPPADVAAWAQRAEIIVAKHRQEATGMCVVQWIGEVTGFRNLARDRPEDW